MAAITTKAVRDVLRRLADSEIASHSAAFFKSGPGEYGEGDKFLGIRVPVLRKKVKAFRDAPLSTVQVLLRSNYEKMPRTMLRYAIEKFPEDRRKAYLHGTV